MAGRYDERRCSATWGRVGSNHRPKDYERLGYRQSQTIWRLSDLLGVVVGGLLAGASDAEGREKPDGPTRLIVCAYCCRVGHPQSECEEWKRDRPDRDMPEERY